MICKGQKGTPKSSKAIEKRYHHGDLPRALMTAAVRLIRDVGPRGFSMADACRAARVSVAAPYRHFANKEALIAAIAEEGFIDLGIKLRKSLEAVECCAYLSVLGRTYVDFSREQSAHFRAMFSAGIDKRNYPQLLAAAEESFSVLHEIVEAGQAGGYIRSGDPECIAHLYWIGVHGIAMLVIEQSSRFPECDEEINQLVDSYSETLLAGLRPA